MKRADLTPIEEFILNLYNDTNNNNKIELEKIRHFYFENGKVSIECENIDSPLGYDLIEMKTILPKKDVDKYNKEQYHRAIELAVQAVHNHRVGMDNWLSIKEIYSLKEIY